MPLSVAQLANPDRPVVLSIGDGSVMYSSSGLDDGAIWFAHSDGGLE